MKFYDTVRLTVSSGKGGDGVVSARRELHLPRGGPAGGNGGKGGSVIFVATTHENTLLPYRYRKAFKAANGEAGMSREKYGKNAEDLVLPVPVGTVIKDVGRDRIITTLDHHGARVIVAKGGQGGIGNMHFKDSVRQFPNFAVLGEPGHELVLELELQLLGDVALIGTPSVGKSTIINAVSNVKAKVADYPFTTIIPNLGSVSHRESTFNMVDVPGLIQGASEGKGLGNAFLRHILRAPIRAFVTDISRYESGMQDVGLLIQEICSYVEHRYIEVEGYDDIHYQREHHPDSKQLLLTIMGSQDHEKIILMKKFVLFVINKIDMIDDDEIVDEYSKSFAMIVSDFFQTSGAYLGSLPAPFAISGATGQGMREFLNQIVSILAITQAESDAIGGSDTGSQEYEYRPHADHTKNITDITDLELDHLIEQEMIDEDDIGTIHVWKLDHPDIARLVWITMWGNDEAEMRFWNIIHKQGLIDARERQGLDKGHIIKFVSPYEQEKDRYIKY